jgi:CO/xanthine dehydrogenase Mo-binding subunit
MRAPGAVSGMFALECAMDELAYALQIDPLELRLINYAEVGPESGRPFSSKALRECYRLGAEKFGWKDRKFELGDTKFPRAPSQGGSQTTSSVGSAVHGAALTVGARLLSLANRESDSPLQGAAVSDVEMLDGRLRLKSDPSRFVSVSEVMRRNGLTEITETFESRPSPEREKYASRRTARSSSRSRWTPTWGPSASRAP